MNMFKVFLKSIVAFTVVVLNAFAENPRGEIFNLWQDGKMPDYVSDKTEIVDIRKNGTRIIKEVPTPTLEVFLSKSANPEAGFVLVCPGGGYYILSYDSEGTHVAKRLAENGVSAAVLKYRVPKLRNAALQDAQRAIRFIRANSTKWNFNPEKIVIIGFSAGANLSARASTLYRENSYDKIDAVDELSPKPNFTGLMYPAYCDEPSYQRYWGSKAKVESVDYNTDYELSSELKIDADTPPTFIMQAQNDKTWINSSIAYFLALKKAKVPVNLHIFDKGGHGFGMVRPNELIEQWFDLFTAWLKKNEVIISK